jgi:L-asparaginase / beta-aspartyl-peptidase
LKPSLIVHGGAGNIPDSALEDSQRGIRQALESGWAVLSRDGSAMDAVEAAIVSLEDDPRFDAGVGSYLNRDGQVQLDAILMDGGTLKAGAVAAVERIRNPIRLARLVLEKSDHMMLAGAGAEQFAVENGMSLCAPEELITDRARAARERLLEVSLVTQNRESRSNGTVGAVAIDSQGQLAAGTSTGGTNCKFPGRVGDTPLVGCGCYADSEAGGVSCTGYGEGIMKIVMAKMAVDLLRDPRVLTAHRKKPGSATIAQAVADACVRILARRAQAAGGLILLDREGRAAAAFSTPHMPYGLVKSDGSFQIAS